MYIRFHFRRFGVSCIAWIIAGGFWAAAVLVKILLNKS